MVYKLYKYSSASVKTGKEHSEWKPINCGVQQEWKPINCGVQQEWKPINYGVQQGFPLSPLLFIIFILMPSSDNGD